jgi:hypothetical protein
MGRGTWGVMQQGGSDGCTGCSNSYCPGLTYKVKLHAGGSLTSSIRKGHSQKLVIRWVATWAALSLHALGIEFAVFCNR